MELSKLSTINTIFNKKGNHSKTVTAYIEDRTKREHRARQSLFTSMEKANCWSENCGLPYFQLFVDKDGDLILYSSNGDKKSLFPEMSPAEIMALSLHQIYIRIKDSINRKKKQENEKIMNKIWKEFDSLSKIVNKEEQHKEYEKSQNCNVVNGRYLLLLSPETEEMELNESNKKTVKRKTDYVKGLNLEYYQRNNIVFRLAEQIENCHKILNRIKNSPKLHKTNQRCIQLGKRKKYGSLELEDTNNLTPNKM